MKITQSFNAAVHYVRACFCKHGKLSLKEDVALQLIRKSFVGSFSGEYT